MKTSAFATAVAPTLEALRAAYLAEIEKLATKLRPRFESGELRGSTDEDFEQPETAPRLPYSFLEDLCRRHFGLVVKEKTLENGDVWESYDDVTAYLVLLVSPAARVLPEDSWRTMADGATERIAIDVIAVARARGWYDSTAETYPPAKATRWARARAA